MKAQPLVFYLPDTRGVELSAFGKGNAKIGRDVYTYSRLPGYPSRRALGSEGFKERTHGTCPGASPECEAICYARRPVEEGGAVYELWARNSETADVPPIPDDCRLLRLHVSGDFDEVAYIYAWIERLTARPDVLAWGYTRSWRVPRLLPALERLRALPNVQLFASIDQSIPELPPAGWRRAWIDGDMRAEALGILTAFDYQVSRNEREHNTRSFDGTPTYVCPEETGRRPDCASCGYCFRGRRHDVTFLRH